MSVRIIVNDAQLSDGLMALQDRLVRLRPVFGDIGEALLTSTRARFTSESGPDGAKWAPLSRRYAKWKARKGRSKTILQLNGYLFGSLAYQASDTHLELGTTPKYSAIHQFGGISFSGQRVGHVRLKTNRKGDVVLNKRGLATFVENGSKLHAVRTYATGYHEVRQVARPFLGLSKADIETVRTILATYLEKG